MADVAPVVYGQWIDGECSVCGFNWLEVTHEPPCCEMPFCPRCGKEMEVW